MGQDYSEYIGKPTGASRVRIERGPILRFAESVKSESPVYRDSTAAADAGFDDVPAPPTMSFSAFGHWGKFAEEQPQDPTGGSNPMQAILGTLMSGGGIILHGEQEFEYHQPVMAGMVLNQTGRIADVYAKASGDKTMTFVVTEDEFRTDEGDLVLVSRSNILHRG